MKQPKKNQPSEAGFSSVNGRNQDNRDSSTMANISPLKAESVIEALLEHGNLNTIEAGNVYGETCLHSSVSDLFRRFKILIPRKDDHSVPRTWTHRPFKRYYITDDIRQPLEAVLAQLQQERGVSKEVAE